LHRKHVHQLAIVALGPKLISVGNRHELRRDSDSRARAPNASLEHRRDTQPLTDLSRLGVLSLERERRGARGNVKSIDACQRIDDILGECRRRGIRCRDRG
jgi:hypothetical protein